MRIISLNTWGGRAGKEKLLEFLKKQRETTDVFCLQEIWSAPYAHLEGASMGGKITSNKDVMVYGMQEISAALPEHTAYFHPHHGEHYGLMMLVRSTLSVAESGDVFVHKHKGYVPEGDVGNHARNIEYVTIETRRGLVTIINFHGLWNGKGKTDCEERFLQSANIVNFTRQIQNPYVLCGDFNLLPDTESLRALEKTGLRNLITEFGVTSTRTSFYTKPEKHADYALVSEGIEVVDFKVLPDEVSDHAPLFLEIK